MICAFIDASVLYAASYSSGGASREIIRFRYRSLVPFMYILLILETLLRMLVGHMKQVTLRHIPA